MWRYEILMSKYDFLEYEELSNFPSSQDGYICGNKIYIKDSLTPQQKHDILAEEIAHHELTYGDITDQSILQNRKYELKARRRGYEIVVSIDHLISAYQSGVQTLYEMSEYLEVSESCVIDSINHYKMKYGLNTNYQNYKIHFDPLQIEYLEV